MLKKLVNSSMALLLVLSMIICGLPVTAMADDNDVTVSEIAEVQEEAIGEEEILEPLEKSDFNEHYNTDQTASQINIEIEVLDSVREKNITGLEAYILVKNAVNDNTISVYRMGYTEDGVFNVLLEKEELFSEEVDLVTMQPIIYYWNDSETEAGKVSVYEKVDVNALDNGLPYIELDSLNAAVSELENNDEDGNNGNNNDGNNNDGNSVGNEEAGDEELVAASENDLTAQDLQSLETEKLVTATFNDSESELILWTGIQASDLSFVQFAVWSEANGQDDLQWYGANKCEDGYQVRISSNNLKETGTYIVHAYYWDLSGTAHMIGTTEVNLSAPEISAIEVGEFDESTATFSISLKDLTAKSGIAQARVAVWSESDQSDLCWYTASKNGNNYDVTADLRNHKYHEGNYTIHAYVWDLQGRIYFLGAVSIKIEFDDTNLVTAQLSDNEKTLTLAAKEISAYRDAAFVQFAMWSSNNGQDDLRWIAADKNDNSYTVSLPTDELETGVYIIHAYYWDSLGDAHLLGTAQVILSEPSMNEFVIDECDGEPDCFMITAKSVAANVGISSVRMAVWCADDQSDIFWYTAVADGDDYSVKVDLKNHKYHAGTYKIHMYVQDGNGRTFLLGATSKVVELDDDNKVTAKITDDQNTLILTASGREVTQNASFVQFAVWSTANGQDDLKWITAANVDGIYQAELQAADLKETGVYIIHAYYWDSNNTANFIGSVKINISGPSVGNVVVEKKDYGFRVNFESVYLPASMACLNVAVWCDDDRSHLTWTPVRGDNGAYYMDVYLKDYGMELGVYHIHVYAIDGNGVQTFCASTDYTVTMSNSGVYAQVDADGVCTVTIKDLYPFSGWSNIGIAVWSKQNGQDDITWYSAASSGNDYQLVLKPGQLKEIDTYLIHVYATDAAGTMRWVGNTEIAYSPVNVVSVEQLSSVTRKVTIYGASYNGTIAADVFMPTWTEAGNQDDIIWIPATQESAGVFSATVNGFEFNRSGKFITHIYGTVNGTNCLLGATTYSIDFKWEFNDYAKSVMRNIIYAVETGGQVYGNAQYNCFAPAYNISSNEKAITIGAGGWYATEAQKLLKLIREANPTEFAELDTAGISEDLDTQNWATYGSDGNGNATILRNSAKAVCIQVLISTSTGKAIQDQLVDEEMTKYVQEALNLGVTDLKAQMFLANVRHLGGYTPMKWVVNCCIEDGKELTMQNLYDSMRDHTANKAGNGVGANIYNSRHTKVMQWLNTYIG